MARTKISEFSATPASNTDIDSINLAEGCAPSGINDAIRELMAQLKDWQSGTSNDPMVIGSSGSLTLNQGTANGVTYLNGSKVVTSGSALTFDGTTFTSVGQVNIKNDLLLSDSTTTQGRAYGDASGVVWRAESGLAQRWHIGSTEQMRLTSTGLGIGTSSPSQKLTVNGGLASIGPISALTASSTFFDYNTTLNSGRFAVVGNTTGTAAPIVFSQYSSNGSVGRDAATLDSSGNLGLGVTPSAGGATANYRLFEIGLDGGGSIYSGTNQTLIGTNIAWSGGTPNYKRTGSAPTLYNQQNGSHSWSTAPSGTAGNAITFTQAMTLDASGNLGLGTTSPSAKLDVTNGASPASRLRVGVGGGAANTLYSTLAAGDYINFETNGSERARIDSSGNLLIGTTTIPSASAGGAGFEPSSDARTVLKLGSTTTAGTTLQVFYNPNGAVGTIQTSGSATSYNTSSDYRLKNTIAPMTGALAKVALLKPCTYKWNADGSDGEGFIAHELAEVCPHAVTGEKDAVDENGNPKYQGIDTSFLVATLTAAIQELKAEFDAYKASHP